MAPVTRARATNADLVPTELHAAYYGQRAGAGLIITEGAWVSERAIGFSNVPGIYSERQVAGWRRVTDVVHALGGRIVVQLWHAGANSHPDHLGGALPAGPSAINPGEISPTPGGRKATVTPREMTVAEIERTVADYAAAAANARRAGFDGVEIAANGTYLIAQFLNPRLNRRTDRYGDTATCCCSRSSTRWPRAWDGRRRRRAAVAVLGRRRPGRTPTGRAAEYPYTADEQTLAATTSSWPGSTTGRWAICTCAAARRAARWRPGPRRDRRYRRLFGGPLIANHGFDRASGNAIVEAGSRRRGVLRQALHRQSRSRQPVRARPGAGHQRPEHPLLRRRAGLRRLPDLAGLLDLA